MGDVYLLEAEYASLGDFTDFNEDYYEEMFYVIQRLSISKIDGEVNEERVKRYLGELKKYKNN